MIVANKLKEENISEYLLYMWQIEDLIRANNFDINKIEKNIISAYQTDDKTKNNIKLWYDNLIELMHNEKVEKKGHIQPLKNIINDLTDLHLALLKSPLHNDYKTEYQKAAPIIQQSFSKMSNKEVTEIEVCFTMLYGLIILKLKKQEISDETKKAILLISKFIALLSKKYKDREEENLEL